jgi:predicted LPLAT superfamily acyltransferase
VPSWEGRSKGTPLGYRTFVWVLRNGGVLPAYGLLGVVTCYYFFFSPRSSGILYRYFRQRIGFTRLRSIIGIYRNYYLFGQSLIDKVVLMSAMPHSFTFDFEGESFLREMVEQGRGGLLLSGHIGNWEIAGHLLQRLGTRIHIVMYDAEHQRIKDYLNSVTGDRKANIIVIRDDLSHIYAISEAFQRKELVCIHADRFVAPAKTMTASFLGSRAQFPAGPFILAATYKVPVSFVFALKESALHYHFFASKPRPYHGLEKNVVVPEILQDFCMEMAEKVKKYPEQWYNYYNFWQL